MLQAHSFLWNYLWVAPNVYLLIIAPIAWKRGTLRGFPAFVWFAILSGTGDLAVFAADVVPAVSATSYWRLSWTVLLIESFIKFVVIGELFSRILNPFSSISKLGRVLVSGFGGSLVLVASLVAANARGDSSVRLISGFHLLQQTVFFVELGLVVFVFLFSTYFGLSLDRVSFGILLGFGVSACAHLAGWAISANADPSARVRTLLDFADMSVHHVCVIIWGFYLLVPGKTPTRPPKPPRQDAPPPPSLPDNDLDLWNRELESLLQR